MNWNWLLSKTLWANALGLIGFAVTYWGLDQKQYAQIIAVAVPVVNFFLRTYFGLAPGTDIVVIDKNEPGP